MNILTSENSYKAFDRVIIIGGSARSGTTIMGKIINSLAEVEYFFEPPALTSLLLKDDELSDLSLKELLKFYFIDGFLMESLSGRGINLNKEDDSCIFHAKTEYEISKRYSKSFRRIELEKALKSSNLAFKLPEIVFFLDIINRIIPSNRTILMHRNPNDVINSIVRKKWFSNEYLDIKHPSQVYPIEVINSIKVPYWVKQKDKEFWVKSNELNRCAYYYKSVSEEILNNSGTAIIIDYDEFIKKPFEIFSNLIDRLGLRYGEKTEEILSTVKYQDKQREDYSEGLNSELLSDIENIDERLKELSFKCNPPKN